MTDPRTIQHPDVTAAEETGYPWFPHKIVVEATEKDAYGFCQESFENFFAFLLTAYPYAIDSYLSDNDDQFAEYVLCGD